MRRFEGALHLFLKTKWTRTRRFKWAACLLAQGNLNCMFMSKFETPQCEVFHQTLINYIIDLSYHNLYFNIY